VQADFIKPIVAIYPVDSDSDVAAALIVFGYGRAQYLQSFLMQGDALTGLTDSLATDFDGSGKQRRFAVGH
jgi:hypothetical protein